MLAGVFLAIAGLVLQTNAARTSTTMLSRAAASFRAEQDRMRKERETSEANLTGTVSVSQARRILHGTPRATAGAISLIEEGLRTARASQTTRLLRTQAPASLAQKYSPSPGLKKARETLGGMISEATIEYDRLNLECSRFFKKQCSLLETCREDISSSNSQAADWRGKVLEAQGQINVCEIRLPRLKEDLQTSERECKRRLGYLRRDLGIVLGDIQVMEDVLALTDCNQALLLQDSKEELLRCPPPCTNISLAAVNHQGLRQQLARLRSSHAQQLVQDGLLELVRGSATTTPAPGSTSPKVTTWTNPPLPQQALPDDPCAGINYDAGTRGTGGCSIRTNPNCENLQNKFLSIQGETVDKRDELQQEIKELEENCEKTKLTLEKEIEEFEEKASAENTRLATATAGENGAAEEGQMKAIQHTQMKTQMLQTRTTCSSKFRTLESELCALKKIRGELFKMKGDQHPFFQDCQVSDWQTQACSASCGGGVQQLERTVLMPATGGGAACPILQDSQSCNEQPCPVDCVTSEWSGFSACSAECGGGVSERSRNIKVQPRYEGQPCGELEETVPCNMQACDKDCDLTPWSAWSACSKACDGGSKTRRKHVSEAAVGRGKCAAKDDPERLERQPCNSQPCPRDMSVALQCTAKVDVVLLLDGSGSVGSSGWAATKLFAKKFLGAFKGTNANARVALLTFSGPYSWTVLRKCTGKSTAAVNLETDCKIRVVKHFTSDISSLETAVDGLQWPRGTTLTSLALELAMSEFLQGRADAERIVLTITDGIPVSPRSTQLAAAKVRKEDTRLMFGAVRLSNRGLRYMRDWGSKPSGENILKIRNFKDLESMNTVDALVADMCRTVEPPRVTGR